MLIPSVQSESSLILRVLGGRKMCASATLEPGGAQDLIYTQTDKLLLSWPSNKGSCSLYVSPHPTKKKCCLKRNKSGKAQWFGQESLMARFYGSIYFKVYFSLFSGKTMAFFLLAVDLGKADMVSLPPICLKVFQGSRNSICFQSDWLISLFYMHSRVEEKGGGGKQGGGKGVHCSLLS